MIVAENKGWYSRGYLPHFDAAVWQSITFRLHDSVPSSMIDSWRKEHEGNRESERSKALRRQIEKYSDAGHGCCWLRENRCAEILEDQLRYHDGNRYDLHSWVVMPNHVHILAKIHDEIPLGKIVQSWKSRTARKINEHLGREGRVWQRDYFDRYIRDEEHFWRMAEYIENNPVKAGLVSSPRKWSFSSASSRDT